MEFALILSLLASSLCGVPSGYRLVWSDEFEGNSIDSSKWGYDIVNGGWRDNELEYYTNSEQNSYVQDGVLHIKAIKESSEGNKYTSARLITEGKFEFQFGYVEARIALPIGQGIWPAFRLIGNYKSPGWPACGEIDIVEARNTENEVLATCHWLYGGHLYHTSRSNNFDITQFHTYFLYWDKEYIRVGIDDNQYYELLIRDGISGTGAFLQNKFSFILNVAVGGNWPGFTIDDGQFPNEMKVDYIRVYQP